MGVYEWDKCPYCGMTIGHVRRGVASDTTIGEPLEKCMNCGGIFKTGKSEWADKCSLSKIGYGIRVLWWCLGSFILATGAGFVITLFTMAAIFKLPDERTFPTALIIGLILGVISILFVINIARNEINDSKRKVSNNN